MKEEERNVWEKRDRKTIKFYKESPFECVRVVYACVCVCQTHVEFERCVKDVLNGTLKGALSSYAKGVNDIKCRQ